VLLIQTGILLIGLGLLAEILTRIYLDGRHRRIYRIEELVPAPIARVRRSKRA
jgi:hypothetical protein